jgi:P pilus assembly chaperone PapD
MAPTEKHNITVRNGNQEVLIQSWIDPGDAQVGHVPFAITPPLAKILPRKEKLLRILYEGKGMSRSCANSPRPAHAGK